MNIPLEQFQLEHGQSTFSEQIAPLVRLQNEIWTLWNREHVLSGRGLARRPLSARRVHVKWPHTLRSVYTISHTAQTEMCADFKSEWRGTENISQCSQSEHSCIENLFREHFVGVVYREHMNGPNEDKVLCPRAQLLQQADLNQGPNGWGSMVLSTEPGYNPSFEHVMHPKLCCCK